MISFLCTNCLCKALLNCMLTSAPTFYSHSEANKRKTLDCVWNKQGLCSAWFQVVAQGIRNDISFNYQRKAKEGIARKAKFNISLQSSVIILICSRVKKFFFKLPQDTYWLVTGQTNYMNELRQKFKNKHKSMLIAFQLFHIPKDLSGDVLKRNLLTLNMTMKTQEC